MAFRVRTLFGTVCSKLTVIKEGRMSDSVAHSPPAGGVTGAAPKVSKRGAVDMVKVLLSLPK